MQRPQNIITYADIDLKLGIKSSLPNVKATLALLILMWKSEGCPYEVLYSQQNDDIICVSDEVMMRLIEYLAPTYRKYGIADDEFRQIVNNNQLLKSQMESLMVALELVWKVGKIRFQDEGKPNGAERTGGIRFPKVIKYTSNMDIIDSVMIVAEDNYKAVLLNWLGLDLPTSIVEDKQLRRVLTAFSETAVYKLIDRDSTVVFNQENLYCPLINSTDPIDINGDGEAKGALRILKSSLSENLNPYLNYSNGAVTASTDADLHLDLYQKRVDAFLSLSTTKILGVDEDIEEHNSQDGNNDTELYAEQLIRFKTGYQSNFERNRIVFGAPGTGKSYKLKEDCKILLDENQERYERVTFHPDYTYSHFVGTYKPVTDADDKIRYEFVPGPFMRVYVAALRSGRTQTPQPHLLLIEEINRAKVAAVFGDVFQLLDRDEYGVSEYEIHATEDIRNYLAKELDGVPADFNRIKIPDNMFIWATMNSADQGVFPMDTAFKRRWDFEYIGINNNENSNNMRGKITLGRGNHALEVEYNKLRKAINCKLTSSDYRVNEDKLLGPFFLSEKVREINDDGKIMNPDKFKEAFKCKVLMYLYEDAAKQHNRKLFEGCGSNSTYSSVCVAFDEIGIDIFGTGFRELYAQQGV